MSIIKKMKFAKSMHITADEFHAITQKVKSEGDYLEAKATQKNAHSLAKSIKEKTNAITKITKKGEIVTRTAGTIGVVSSGIETVGMISSPVEHVAKEIGKGVATKLIKNGVKNKF